MPGRIDIREMQRRGGREGGRKTRCRCHGIVVRRDIQRCMCAGMMAVQIDVMLKAEDGGVVKIGNDTPGAVAANVIERERQRGRHTECSQR